MLFLVLYMNSEFQNNNGGKIYNHFPKIYFTLHTHSICESINIQLRINKFRIGLTAE